MSQGPRRSFGNKGEALAASFLRAKGLKIIGLQERTRFGEIDIICLDQDELVFVEVKTRRTETYGYPEASVTKEKISHICRSAQDYLNKSKFHDHPWRIDVVAIQLKEQETPEIIHFPAIDIPFETW